MRGASTELGSSVCEGWSFWQQPKPLVPIVVCHVLVLLFLVTAASRWILPIAGGDSTMGPPGSCCLFVVDGAFASIETDFGQKKQSLWWE